MRRSTTWTELLDERILELLAVDGPLRPSRVATDDRVPWKPGHVAERCRRLAANGLARHVGDDAYAITDDGERYLDGRTAGTSRPTVAKE
ncbi:helix-turn-helix domain-containing protein [Halomicrococcus gelatinilyticus]|uniref:MarR family transcriptional regulator n=1 Tax=Halomicrococcus gelatinilyticus TaxID=1702103 RepID=UPI002E146052